MSPSRTPSITEICKTCIAEVYSLSPSNLPILHHYHPRMICGNYSAGRHVHNRSNHHQRNTSLVDFHYFIEHCPWCSGIFDPFFLFLGLHFSISSHFFIYHPLHHPSFICCLFVCTPHIWNISIIPNKNSRAAS